MIKGTTTSGFDFEIDEELLEDAEFLELFAATQDKDKAKKMKIFDLIRCALGEEQKNALFDHCRNEKGRVPVSALTDEVADILSALGNAKETKN